MYSLILFHWDDLYRALGIKEFIYFISSPSIQDALFPVKIVFIFFTAFFFCALIWFYTNSSYLQFKFLQDTTEFFSKQTYGLTKINNSWKKIKKRADSGNAAELKLAVIEADDFLYETLQDRGYNGDSFEELMADAAKKTGQDVNEILDAHTVRNSVVYDPDYKLDTEVVNKIMTTYEAAIKNISLS